jgi:hypothetical protein
VKPGGLRVAQCPSDETIGRKLYDGDIFDDNSNAEITLLEPICTGLFKTSIRDKSMYTGKKSPFIAHEGNWSIRFNVKQKLLAQLFQTYHSRTIAQAVTGLAPFFSYVTVHLEDAYVHVQYAKPLVEVPRHVRYSWPRVKVYSQSWQYAPGKTQKLRWPHLRAGSVPDAMFVTHRLKHEDEWFDVKHVNATLERSAYVQELQVRHNLSDKNINIGDGDRSKTLLFQTKRNFDYRTVAPNHRYGQVVGISRSDLAITEQALKSMQGDGSIEVGVKLVVAAKLDDLGVIIANQLGITDGPVFFANSVINIGARPGTFPAGQSPNAVANDYMPDGFGFPSTHILYDSRANLAAKLVRFHNTTITWTDDEPAIPSVQHVFENQAQQIEVNSKEIYFIWWNPLFRQMFAYLNPNGSQFNIPDFAMCEVVEVPGGHSMKLYAKNDPVGTEYNEGYGVYRAGSMQLIGEYMFDRPDVGTSATMWYRDGVQTFGSLIEVNKNPASDTPAVYIWGQIPYKYHIGHMEVTPEDHGIWTFKPHDHLRVTNSPAWKLLRN